MNMTPKKTRSVKALGQITDDVRERVKNQKLPAFFGDLIDMHDKINEIITTLNQCITPILKGKKK